MRDFKKLEIWQDAMKMVVKVYHLTKQLPDDEKFNLTQQIRRCSVSIPSNIAEGSGRKSDKDRSRFIEFSLASSFELETQLILCRELDFINETQMSEILKELDSLQKRITKFQDALN